MLGTAQGVETSAGVPAGVIAAGIDPERIEGRVRDSRLKRVRELVERYPEQSLTVIRRWMAER
jgi:flagellar M-ring protein FliF